MALKIFKGKMPNPNNLSVWAEEFRIKNLTTNKRNLIKKLSKGKELKEE